MNHLNPISSTYVPHNPLQQVEITMPEASLAIWLQSVARCSSNFSSEDQRRLIELANNIPHYSNASPDLQDVLDKIKIVVAKMKWDPSLSPASSKALLALLRQLTPAKPSPACRKLEF